MCNAPRDHQSLVLRLTHLGLCVDFWGDFKREVSNSTSVSLQPWPGLEHECAAVGVREEKAGFGLAEKWLGMLQIRRPAHGEVTRVLKRLWRGLGLSKLLSPPALEDKRFSPS